MTGAVLLRDVTDDDLPIFFDHQRDPDANHMAAFPARDQEAFIAHWAKIRGDRTVIVKTILFNGNVAGNVVTWEESGKRNVGYWIGRVYWGSGVATKALSEFVRLLKARPLYAHVATHNVASLRVLQKCGFTVSGTARASAHDPGGAVDEFILQLG